MVIEGDITIEFCPLCGAHPCEQGEGIAGDEEIVRREAEIKKLYHKLLRLTEEEKPE